MKFMGRAGNSCTFKGNQIAHEANGTSANVGDMRLGSIYSKLQYSCSYRLIPSLFQYIRRIVKRFANVLTMNCI